MEISNFDKAIKESIEAVVSSPDGMPIVYCGWLPASRRSAGVMLQKVERSYPAFIQYTDDKVRELDNGMLERTVDFYLVNPGKEDKISDVLFGRAIHNVLEKLVFDFRDILSTKLICNIEGDLEMLYDQLTNLENGVFFTMKIQIEKEC